MAQQYVVFTPEQFRALDDKLTEISQGGGASVDLTGYLKSADAYTKAQTDSAIASAIDSKLAALDANSTAY